MCEILDLNTYVHTAVPTAKMRQMQSLDAQRCARRGHALRFSFPRLFFVWIKASVSGFSVELVRICGQFFTPRKIFQKMACCHFESVAF